ncbi:Uncharacterized conserved protein, DUF2252 family [Sphingomonas sp. NFR04]|uniref:DUF2252 family protein n=1 Tax=Sphingomonas sp. NFR04 TaxID=1566283 RepID=UPI0008EA6407|nr:DUF2252 family protein [Sphingomonas sp. NFR04]SFK11619.1 Uncharacterized conserved protein, DUF2252 family [Sphingomonas sp. NFR04]
MAKKPAPLSPAERSTILEANRTLKMARSAHAYVRGNTAKFYDWLESSPVSARVPQGPSIWICGDCHVGNLGPLSNGDGRVEVQIRDMDQAVIGNPAHDIIRLGLSLATAARGADLPGVVTAQMLEEMMEGYVAAIHDPTSGDPGVEPEVVQSVKRRALGRRWRHLAKERLDAVEPQIPLGKRFWPIEDKERAALEAALAKPAVLGTVLGAEDADAAREIRLVDAAYWMKGCSSLGLLRYAAIVAIPDDKGRKDYALIDLKEAIDPIAPAAPGAELPKDNADRVVAAARALSPHLGRRMAPVRMLGRSLFVRELAPQDLKLELDQFSRGEAVKSARYLAFVVGRAHARQMDTDARAAWLEILAEDRRGNLDTPSWLWESVVSLAGRHEVGYLEHCRRYAVAA